MTLVSPELLKRFDVPGPRYTSYPTADRFVEAFSGREYAQALAQRRSGAFAGALPLSLYVHIPFCESLCYYCACNKIITRQHGRATSYLQYLEREIALQLEQLGPGQRVSQLHLGGGTPTFLSDAELATLMQMLKRAFSVAPGAEYSIEVDPRTVDRDRLAHLVALGFNRLSFGVQDFEPAVQKAVHRLQPEEQVAALLQAARELGFESINVECALRAARRQSVKERGCEIQQHHGAREHARTYDSRYVSTLVRHDDQNREGSQRRQQAEAVANAVRDLLSEGLWPLLQA